MTNGDYNLPGGQYVVVENDYNRVVAEGGDLYFDSISVQEKQGTRWVEILHWVDDEWREKANEAFEAIISVIAKVAAGQPVKKP